MITELFRFNGDGWWPRISNDASKVCFGNTESRVFEINTGRVWSAFPARQSRWIHDDVVTFTVQIGENQAKRFTRNWGGVQEHTDNPSLVAGNDFDADKGHWLSCLSAGRLVLDGRIIDGRYRNAQMRWPWVVATKDDAELVWWRDGVHYARAPLPARANELRLQDSSAVRTGYFWDVQDIGPHAAVVDVTATPWRREKPHVMCADHNWTSTETPDGRLGTIGANAQDSAFIIDDWGCAWFDVKLHPVFGFIVAGCDDTGKLRVYAVSTNTEHRSISAWGQIANPSSSPSPSKSHSPSHSPSPSHAEEEEPMPTHLSDLELIELANRLEKKYKAPTAEGGLGRGPTETFVDVLGASRWRWDYINSRNAGDDMDTAWRKVNRAINDVVPELEGDIDPNFP
jgi:hypothetical protein